MGHEQLNQFDEIFCAEFLHDFIAVVLNGSDRSVKDSGDTGIVISMQYQPKHADFMLGQLLSGRKVQHLLRPPDRIDDGKQMIGPERFFDKILGARFESPDRGAHIGMVGDKNHRKGGAKFLNPFQNVKAIKYRHFHFADQQVMFLLDKAIEVIPGTAEIGNPVIFRLQGVLDHSADRILIIHDTNMHKLSPSFRSYSSISQFCGK
jgi:hypothetical protein